MHQAIRDFDKTIRGIAPQLLYGIGDMRRYDAVCVIAERSGFYRKIERKENISDSLVELQEFIKEKYDIMAITRSMCK